jgi:hypothetical protein
MNANNHFNEQHAQNCEERRIAGMYILTPAEYQPLYLIMFDMVLMPKQYKKPRNNA